MTRGFSPDHLCTTEIEDYYCKRADDGIGMIITEGLIVHQSGNGYKDVPFLETDEQASSWHQCVKRVRSSGCYFVAQLWHCGRISHEDFTGGSQPISSSGTQAEGINRQNGKPFAVPRPVEIQEFPMLIKQFVDAAVRACNVGFDAVELHFGHGYLIDQFLDSRINLRLDGYGGSISNRCRLALEVAEAVISAVGPHRVFVRISPSREMNGLYDWPNLEEMLEELLSGLAQVGLKHLDLSCANADYFRTSGRILPIVRKHWVDLLLGGASLSLDEARSEVTSGRLELVTWGRAIIANPDFVSRVRSQREMVAFDNSMRGLLN